MIFFYSVFLPILAKKKFDVEAGMENKKIPTAKIPPEAEDDNSQQQRGFFFALKYK